MQYFLIGVSWGKKRNLATMGFSAKIYFREECAGSIKTVSFSSLSTPIGGTDGRTDCMRLKSRSQQTDPGASPEQEIACRGGGAGGADTGAPPFKNLTMLSCYQTAPVAAVTPTCGNKPGSLETEEEEPTWSHWGADGFRRKAFQASAASVGKDQSTSP